MQGLAAVVEDLVRVVALGADGREVGEDGAAAPEGLPIGEYVLAQSSVRAFSARSRRPSWR